jgi:hypothetical protein
MAYRGLRETKTQRGARDTPFSNERLKHHQKIEIKTPRAHIGPFISPSIRLLMQTGTLSKSTESMFACANSTGSPIERHRDLDYELLLL